MSDEEDFAMDLVMPFVVVESAGGPYRDDDWVAGYECGQVAMLLDQHAPLLLDPGLDFPIRTSNVPQVDLLAMNAGYTLVAEELPDDPEWSYLTFTLHKEDGRPALDAVHELCEQPTFLLSLAEARRVWVRYDYNCDTPDADDFDTAFIDRLGAWLSGKPL